MEHSNPSYTEKEECNIKARSRSGTKISLGQMGHQETKLIYADVRTRESREEPTKQQDPAYFNKFYLSFAPPSGSAPLWSSGGLSFGVLMSSVGQSPALVFMMPGP